MKVTSKYVPVELCPDIDKVHWFLCLCESCHSIWLMSAMQERVSCPYCYVVTEPSTILFREDSPNGH